jgi:hypothetical protein
MNSSDASNLDRLIALVEETELLLERSLQSHDVRQACAIARGYLDLAQSYGEPVNVEDIERIVARVRRTFGFGEIAGDSASGEAQS